MKNDALDRFAPSLPPPERALDGFLRRRDRKRRNEKIGAIVLVVVLTAASIAAALAIAGSRSVPQPADQTITTESAPNLHEVAFDPTTGLGFRMSTGDGVLAVGTGDFGDAPGGDQVVVYPYPCGGTDPACTPLWTADVDHPALPTVADGKVYVTGLANDQGFGHTLYAFDVACGTGGASCEPVWSVPLKRPTTPPLVADGRVIVGTELGVRAWSVEGPHTRGSFCAAGCATNLPVAVRSMAYDAGVLYVGTGLQGGPDPANAGWIRAYTLPCAVSGGTCPLWSARAGQVWDMVVDGDTLFVGTNGHENGVQAYPTSCDGAGGPCKALWVASTDCCTRLTVADGMVFAHDHTSHVYAFTEDCRSDGSPCAQSWSSSGIFQSNPFVDFSRPLVSGGVVFAGGHGGVLYAFSETCSAECAPIWEAPFNGAPLDAVALDDHVYVAVEDGLHVFSTSDEAAAASSPGVGAAPWFYGVIALVAIAVFGIRFARRRA